MRTRPYILGMSLLTAATLDAQVPRAIIPATDSLRLYYVGRPVGWERYELKSDAAGVTLSADLDYVDRGRRNHVVSTTSMAHDYTPRRLEAARVSDTSRMVTVRVDVDERHATVLRSGQTTSVELPPVAFAIAPYTPVSQHLALLRYWESHGRPSIVAVVPGGPTNQVTIRKRGISTLIAGGQPISLTRYTIDGVVWGLEYVWLDNAGRLAMFASAAGGLSFKAVRADLVPVHSGLMTAAAVAMIGDLATISARTSPVAAGKVALVGATLIDGSGRAAVPNATVIVADGRVVAAGPSASTPVPAGSHRIDVAGKTIVDISNIRRLRLVMNGGKLYDSAALWRGAGFTP